MKKLGKSFWVSFSGIAGRILLSLFQNSYKNWKGKFFRVCSAKHDPTALDGLPLYWTERPKLLRAKTLEELSPADREVSKALEIKATTLEEEMRTLGRQNETYQTSLKQAQESKAETERQLAEALEL